MADEIRAFLQKEDYTLTELNAIKRRMDETEELYKQGGGETAGLKAKGLRNIRKEIRKQIEDIADAQGLGDIKMLNNETIIANALSDAIHRKQSAEVARQLIGIEGTIGGALGGVGGFQQGGDFQSALGGFLLGTIGLQAATRLYRSPKIRTYTANFLRRLTKGEKKSLERFIGSGNPQDLTDSAAQKLLEAKGDVRSIVFVEEAPTPITPEGVVQQRGVPAPTPTQRQVIETARRGAIRNPLDEVAQEQMVAREVAERSAREAQETIMTQYRNAVEKGSKIPYYDIRV